MEMFAHDFGYSDLESYVDAIARNNDFSEEEVIAGLHVVGRCNAS
jgi:hypothetical protein